MKKFTQSVGFLLICLAVTMADSEKLYVPFIVAAIGIFLIRDLIGDDAWEECDDEEEEGL